MISTNTPLASPGAAISGANTLVPSPCVWSSSTVEGKTREGTSHIIIAFTSTRVYIAGRIQGQTVEETSFRVIVVCIASNLRAPVLKTNLQRGGLRHMPQSK